MLNHINQLDIVHTHKSNILITCSSDNCHAHRCTVLLRLYLCQVESLPESMQPTTESSGSQYTRLSPSTLTTASESTQTTDISSSVNQTGAVETAFVPAFIVQRRTETAHVVENLEQDDNIHRSDNARRTDMVSNEIPLDVAFDVEGW